MEVFYEEGKRGEEGEGLEKRREFLLILVNTFSLYGLNSSILLQSLCSIFIEDGMLYAFLRYTFAVI